MTDSRKPAQKFFTEMEHRLQEELERDLARGARIDKAQHGGEQRGNDILLPPHMQHNYTSDWESRKKNFQDKIYLFPESYNALRRELEGNWKHLFEGVNPETGVSLAYCMVYDAAQFVGILNGALDMVVQFDSENIDYICKSFLNGLRVKRGVRPLSMED